ncbi:MAG: AAA family ATPase [Proteobacteria bacterium]|nr:AAA family ATPase [Pseudomonadota bacterium]
MAPQNHLKQANRTDEGLLLKSIPRELLFGLLDNPYESLLLIDTDGILRFMSSANEDFFSVNIKDALGRHITEINPDTQLLDTLQTGKAEIGEIMTLMRKKRIIARIPIFKDGRLIGAAGKVMFSHPERLKELYERIETLETNLNYYKNELYQAFGSRYTFDTVIGRSLLILQAKALALQAAGTDSAVVITGESGTGKELFAHAIHQASQRKDSNFVKVNCASIPGELIEAELFGYEPGSFTGAHKKGKPGKFELAHNGTILLDEIGDMPLKMQVKLLRILQEKEVERIGGRKPKRIEFRLICSTNRNIEKMISSGEFRLDLFYRINVINIYLPPLREITDDIPTLFHHFLHELNKEKRKEVERVSQEAMALLKNYAWPGNMRELRNVAERALIVSRGTQIETEDLPPALKETLSYPIHENKPLPMLKDLLEKTEKRAINEALKLTKNNKASAAKLLGIHRTGLYQKMRKYRIS